MEALISETSALITVYATLGLAILMVFLSVVFFVYSKQAGLDSRRVSLVLVAIAGEIVIILLAAVVISENSFFHTFSGIQECLPVAIFGNDHTDTSTSRSRGVPPLSDKANEVPARTSC